MDEKCMDKKGMDEKGMVIRWKIAFGCFNNFFHLISIIITKYFN